MSYNLFNFAGYISNDIEQNQKILFNIGDFIINNFVIFSSFVDSIFYISDLEFYIYSPFSSIDVDDVSLKPIVHCNQRQLLNSKFYIHRIGKSFSLIQGAGIDLTFGIPDKEIFCAILLREIRNSYNNQIFHGPQKVLRTLLGLPFLYGEFKNSFISFANSVENYDVFDVNSPLWLKPAKNHFNVSNDYRVNVNNSLKYRIRVKNP